MKRNLTIISLIALAAAVFPAVADETKPTELIAGDVFSNFQPTKDWFLTGAVEAVPGKNELS